MRRSGDGPPHVVRRIGSEPRLESERSGDGAAGAYPVGRTNFPWKQAEQRQTDAHGGPTNMANPVGDTENARNEIGSCRGSRVGNSGANSIC